MITRLRYRIPRKNKGEIYRLEGEPKVSGDCEFTDVASGTWYEDAIIWAAANDIVNGYGETFGPEDSITREQLATILYRYAEFKGEDVTSGGDLSKYADADRIGNYAVEAMQWAVDEKLISGISETTLEPRSEATRAQVAAILARFDKFVVE